jgi:hypothetical protein
MAMFKSSLCLVVLLVFAGGSVQAQESAKWFDLENCEMCKCLGEHKELMSVMKMDIKTFSNGMLMIVTVPEEQKELLAQCREEMKKKSQSITADTKMCGFCHSFGELMMAGAKVEELDTVAGPITIITSDDPELVQKIHQHAKRSIEEHEKMEKASAGER